MGRIRNLWVLLGLVMFTVSVCGKFSISKKVNKSETISKNQSPIVINHEEKVCDIENDRVESFNDEDACESVQKSSHVAHMTRYFLDNIPKNQIKLCNFLTFFLCKK